MDWAAVFLASTLPAPHPHSRYWVHTSLLPTDFVWDEYRPPFLRLHVLHGGLCAADFCGGYYTCLDIVVRQDLQSREVPDRVVATVPDTFC